MAKDKLKNTPTAHGKTPTEMKNRHQRQLNGEEPETIAANGKDAGDYRVDKDEAHLVHIQLEIPNYNQVTGDKLSKPSTQILSVKEYEAAKLNNGFVGYAVKILHAPTGTQKEEAVATVGTEAPRVVDSNYAAMQARYEVLAGREPNPSWTEVQLDIALRTAEDAFNRAVGARNAPAPMDQSAAPAHTAPHVSTPDTDNATDGEGGTDEHDAAANAAEAAAANANPTGDANGSAGQVAGRGESETGSQSEGGSESKDADKAPAATGRTAPTGRRGAAPAATKKPAATSGGARE